MQGAVWFVTSLLLCGIGSLATIQKGLIAGNSLFKRPRLGKYLLCFGIHHYIEGLGVLFKVDYLKVGPQVAYVPDLIAP